jgi:hypothetical protein
VHLNRLQTCGFQHFKAANLITEPVNPRCNKMLFASAADNISVRYKVVEIAVNAEDNYCKSDSLLTEIESR